MWHLIRYLRVCWSSTLNQLHNKLTRFSAIYLFTSWSLQRIISVQFQKTIRNWLLTSALFLVHSAITYKKSDTDYDFLRTFCSPFDCKTEAWVGFMSLIIEFQKCRTNRENGCHFNIECLFISTVRLENVHKRQYGTIQGCGGGGGGSIGLA